MKFKKVMAVILAATMVTGSSMVAFAEDTPTTDANSATGEGTTFDHVNKDIISVTLPTTADVQDVFDYYVDPEGLIKDAGTLADGNTEVTGNTDGVYFKNTVTSSGTEATDAVVESYTINSITTGLTITIPVDTTAAKLVYKDATLDSAENVSASGWYAEAADGDYTGATAVSVTVVQDSDSTTVTPNSGDAIIVTPAREATTGTATTSYGSSSEAVKFEGKNSVDVDVSVAATVTATDADKDIALVANDEALTASTTPALLMKLKVGTDEKAISSTGSTTAKATIAGVPGNFAVTTENNKFVYKIRTDTDTDNGGTALAAWNATTVQLIGKTNSVDVPTTGVTAPVINLTWSVAKHAETQTPEEPESYVGGTAVSATAKTLTLDLPEGVTVSKVDLVLNGNTTTLARGNHYTVAATSLTIGKYAAGWAGGSIKITYSDDHVDTITCE